MHCHFAPLGIPVLVTVDDLDLAAAVGTAYAEWRTVQPIERPQITLALERGGSPSTDVSLDIRVTGSRLTMQGAGIFGEAEAGARHARCLLPGSGAGADATLMREALDTILLFLLTRSDRTPVHAAGIVLGDLALVLMGPSGSGKSTLALAAARRGLRLLSDDMVFVQTEPQLRLWGFPRPVHVFSEDAPPGPHATRMRGGKLKVAIPAPRAARALMIDHGRLILLQPSAGLMLEETDPSEAVGSLTLEPGFDLLPEQSVAAMRALAVQGVWRLGLSRDPGAAIDLLCAHFGPARAVG